MGRAAAARRIVSAIVLCVVEHSAVIKSPYRRKRGARGHRTAHDHRPIGDDRAMTVPAAIADAPAPTTGSMLPDRADVVVVGGGILGLAVARDLLIRAARTAAGDPRARGRAGRPPDGPQQRRAARRAVLHARLAQGPVLPGGQGARSRQYAEERGIAFDRCGKLVVALGRDGAAGPRATPRACRGQWGPGPRGRRRRADRASSSRRGRAPCAPVEPGTGIIDYRRVAQALRATTSASPAGRSTSRRR